jgi:secondary thiamine-phosphate synthase enzyme
MDIETTARLEVRDVTDRVESALQKEVTGICTAFVHHTTAALIVNEAESRLLGDVETALADLVPGEGWDHDALDGNADAHLRAALLGPSVSVPVSDGALDLGRWQSVLLVECDGPRTRRLSVTVTD